MKRIITMIIVLSLTVILFSGCESPVSNEKPIIITSIVPMKTFIENIVGDHFEVIAIVPPGANPSNYEPSPQELTKISEASYYFTIGVPTEKSNILPKINDFNKDIKMIYVDQELAKVYDDLYFDNEESTRDHHIWLSPKRVLVIIDIIQNRMMEAYPELSESFESNSEDYKKEIISLNQYIEDKSRLIINKSFIIYHPSYNYFAKEYGFEMVAIEEEGKEETAKGIEEVIHYALQNDIKVIFHQAEIDSQQATTIANEIGGITKMLEPLSADYIGSMKNVIDTFLELTE